MGSNYWLARKTMDVMAKALWIADRYSDRGTISRLSASANYGEIRKDVITSLDREWTNSPDSCLDKADSMLDSVLNEEGHKPYICAAEVALWIDRKLTYKTNDKNLYIDLSSLYSTSTRRNSSIDHLNSDDSVQKTRIIIFPKFQCGSPDKDSVGQETSSSFKKGRRKYNRDSLHFLNNKLFNVGYIPFERRQAIIHNIIIYKDRDDRGSRLGQDSFRIAFAPMVSAHGYPFFIRPVTIEENGEPMDGFRIDGLKEPEKLKNRFKEDLLLACEQNADMVFFPEMTGEEAMVDRYNNISKNLQRIGRRNGNSLPCVTIFPTIWKYRKNYAVIADMYGRILGEQKKLYPFILTDKGSNKHDEESKDNSEEAGSRALMVEAEPVQSDSEKIVQGIEDIAIPDIPEITVIHIPGFARIAIMICAQFLQVNEMDSCIDIVCRYLNVNMIIVPSFSGGETDFIRKIKSLEAFGTSVVWGNCCGAIISKERVIGGASIAGTDQIYRFGTKCRCDVNKEGKNRGICSIEDACIFTVTIPGQLVENKLEGTGISDPIEHFFIERKERRK